MRSGGKHRVLFQLEPVYQLFGEVTGAQDLVLGLEKLVVMTASVNIFQGDGLGLV